MPSPSAKLLVQTAQRLSIARSLDEIMDIVRKVARQLTGADGATFVLRDRDLCYYAQEDAISPLWKGKRFPLQTCISGWAMLNKQPVVIPDIYADERIPIDAYRPTFVKSLAMVPIRTVDPIGAIGNYWARHYQPSAEEVGLLQSLADLTSVSIENVYVYNELEERIKQRTEQLEVLNKELEAFSYSVSHDLRAPLRAISGYATMLSEDYGDKMDDRAQHLMKSIEGNTKRMNTLIEDLLKFSRMGRQELRKMDVNMYELARKVVNDVNFAMPNKAQVEIGKLPLVLADSNLIYQVMFNLVSNAVKYSSKKAEAQIEIGAQEKENETVFFVKDNGAGFDMRYTDKLFGVFQRLHSNNDFEGTGVGLALSQRIVSKHGGRIWAEGQVGEGATFWFTLPK